MSDKGHVCTMFSWLFGSGKDGSSGSDPKPPKNETLDVLSSGIDEKMALPQGGLGTFDPSVLERIAKAAKELSQNGASSCSKPLIFTNTALFVFLMFLFSVMQSVNW